MWGIYGMPGSKGAAEKIRKERILEILFYLLVFAAITCFAMVQTYGDPPDEINRFKVVKYIYTASCRMGRIRKSFWRDMGHLMRFSLF